MTRQRYKGKAFVDMLVDRSGKALSALALIAVIAAAETSIPLSLGVAFGAMLLWGICAVALGRGYAAERARGEAAGHGGKPVERPLH